MEEIQLRIVPFMAEFCIFEPVVRKLFRAVGHVFPPENTERKHFFRSQFRLKTRMKIPARPFGQEIDMILLHQVIYNYFALEHGTVSCFGYSSLPISNPRLLNCSRIADRRSCGSCGVRERIQR